jgi:AcrR family transcriptional regulator
MSTPAKKPPRKATPSRRPIGRPHKAASARVGREALTAATRDLLRTVPPARISRALIARHAGVTPALVRYYFGNKEQLLLQATIELSHELRARSRSASGKAGSPSDKLLAKITVLLEMVAHDRHFNQLVMEQIIHGKSARAKRANEEMTEDSFSELHAILTEGVDRREMRKVDPIYLYFLLVGACEIFASGRPMLEMLLGGKPIDDEVIQGYARFVHDLLMRGLAAELQPTGRRISRASRIPRA